MVIVRKIYSFLFFSLVFVHGASYAGPGTNCAEKFAFQNIARYLQALAKDKGITARVRLDSLSIFPWFNPVFGGSVERVLVREYKDSVQPDSLSIASWFNPKVADRVERVLIHGNRDCLRVPNIRWGDATIDELKALRKELVPVFNMDLSFCSRYFYRFLMIMHHELGHVKYKEMYPDLTDKLWLASNHSLAACNSLVQSDEYYKTKFDEELYADAAVPNEYMLLKAARNLMAAHAIQREMPLFLRLLESFKYSVYSSKEIRTKEVLSMVEKLRIDFSSPMNGCLADLIEKYFREKEGDCHPSSYRRAYNFDSRLKALATTKPLEPTSKKSWYDKDLFKEFLGLDWARMEPFLGKYEYDEGSLRDFLASLGLARKLIETGTF